MATSFWTAEEETLLRELVARHDMRWNDIVAEFEAHGHSRTYEAIRRKVRTLKLSKAMHSDDLYHELRRGKPRRISEADLPALVELMARGYGIKVWEESDQKWARIARAVSNADEEPQEYPILADEFNTQELKIGLTSDCHYGSKYALPQVVEHLHVDLERRGAHIIFDCGDTVDGIGMYAGHEFELNAHGGDQLEVAVKEYPRVAIPRRMIGGQHDYSHIKNGGFNILDIFAQLRQDVEFLGYFQAQIPLTDRADIGLMHGKGGMSYARSYKPQKLFEQWAKERDWNQVSGEEDRQPTTWADKPAIIAFGHWHIRLNMEYLGSELILVPCAQRQTPYLRQMGLMPTIGGWLVTLRIADNGRIVGGTYEFLSP